MSRPPISSTALSITSRLRRPRKSIFSRPSASTSLHRELGHDLLVGAFLLQRDDVDQRLGADDDAGGVDRVGAGEALERLRELDDLLRDRVCVDRLAELGAGLQALLERLPGAFRDQLRDPVDDAVGDLEYAAGVAYGGARGHRARR